MAAGGNEIVVDNAARRIKWGELFLEKKLFPSDVGRLNRLAIPKQIAVKHFPELQKDTNYKPDITLVDRHNTCYVMKYELWPKSQNYVLTTGWKKFIKDHKLRANDTIEIYHAKYEDEIGSGHSFVYGIDYKHGSEDHIQINENVIVRSRINANVISPCGNRVRWDKLLFQKTVLSADVGEDNGLVIPVEHALRHFPVCIRGDKRDITFVDVNGVEWVMKYGWWNETQKYCLTEGWKTYAEFLDIHVEDTIQIYASIDNMQYVYGIHHYRYPVSETKTVKLFGQYHIVANSTADQDCYNQLV